MRILFIGDIVSKLGRKAIEEQLSIVKKENNIDFVIANGENITHGKGISSDHYDFLMENGVNVVTLGNHYAQQKDIFDWIEEKDNILRPNNLHKSIPGTGSKVFYCKSLKIRVTNILGRAFINMNTDNIFDSIKQLVDKKDCDLHIVDIHAESTGEKMAIAKAFDGEVTAVLGTHTHVQTADERILPKGTAFISDVGMCGGYDTILGCTPEPIIKTNWYGLPARFETPDEGKYIFSAVILDLNEDDMTVSNIKRIQIIK